jgi:hypothetical protein
MFECFFGDYGGVEHQGRHLADAAGLVLRQQSFSKCSVFFSFCIFFDSVIYSDLSAGEVLSVHLGDGEVGAVEVIIANESMPLAGPLFGISGDLGTDDHAEVAEGFI